MVLSNLEDRRSSLNGVCHCMAFTALCLAVSAPRCLAEGTEVEAAAVTATAAAEARLLSSVEVLAGDDYEGRGIGTAGINKAAEFLAAEFQHLQLKTDWFQGSPFQVFTVPTAPKLGEPADNFLRLVNERDGAETVELSLQDDFTPLAIGASGSVDAPLVFVGYGISAEEPAYDDYAGLDVRDKVVVMLRKEPQQDHADSPFNGKRSTTHATFRTKVKNAVDHGAAAVIVVNDHHDVREKEASARDQLLALMKKLTKLHQAFTDIAEPSDEDFVTFTRKFAKLNDQLSDQTKLLKQASYDRVIRFSEAGSANRGAIPVFFAMRNVIDPLVSSSLGSDLTAIEAQINTDLQPRSGPLTGWRTEGRAAVSTNEAQIKNVIAVLEGEGPLAHETIVVGAHYDHLGMGGPGTLAPWTVEVHNGADDNASGTAGLLEVARRLATRGIKPRRRIVFIAFTGEESGLLGSKHYVRNPRFPLEDTVAMVNLDMIGRLNKNQLDVHGTGTANEFDELIDELNVVHQFDIQKSPSGYGPSDHASFYPEEIPVIFLFTGLHKDYHRPSDDWDKLNIEGMRRVVDFAMDIIDHIDQMDSRPTYQKSNAPRWSRFQNRAYLGVVPDLENRDVDGFLVAEVAKDGPADKAGLQSGDVIVQVGGEKVTSLRDLRTALTNFKPDEKAELKVIRGDEELMITVLLGKPE